MGLTKLPQSQVIDFMKSFLFGLIILCLSPIWAPCAAVFIIVMMLNDIGDKVRKLIKVKPMDKLPQTLEKEIERLADELSDYGSNGESSPESFKKMGNTIALAVLEKAQMLAEALRYIHETQCAGCNLQEVMACCEQALAEWKAFKGDE